MVVLENKSVTSSLLTSYGGQYDIYVKVPQVWVRSGPGLSQCVHTIVCLKVHSEYLERHYNMHDLCLAEQLVPREECTSLLRAIYGRVCEVLPGSGIIHDILFVCCRISLKFFSL